MTAHSIERPRHPVLGDAERRRIHWLALFVLPALLGLIGWSLGLFMSDPVIVSEMV